MKYDQIQWIVSDTHFLHANIVEFCQRPRNHNEVMRDNWTRVVGPDDQVLHLGDLVLGKRADAEALLSGENELPGRKYLIKGNHDKRSRSFYKGLGFEVIDPFVMSHGGWDFHFTHYPMKSVPVKAINVHGHIHNNFVEGLGRQHVNMSVEVRNFTPQSMHWHLDNAIRRMVDESCDRDWGPGGKDFDPPED